MISARIVADSLNTDKSHRLTTFVLTYNRYIHSEIMTHRMFSRNAASSRAIPVKRMIKNIRDNPARPISWGQNQKGMQAEENICIENESIAIKIWDESCWNAIKSAERLINLGVHKQIANRLLEPFAHMTTIVTATEFNNFFHLRAHKDAQPEFRYLAYEMEALYEESEPKHLKLDTDWHLPFADKYMPEGLTEEQLIKICVARCARVSYLNFEGNIDHEKDYALYDNLRTNRHMSPFEHAAQSKSKNFVSGNFRGFLQHRKTILGENRNGPRK